ncbi:formate dehydrogenase H subunit alpha, selenocysteine-containing [Mesobacillus subterraneus]|uniref:Formate dehydrogenase H subunit alpha, selenocysteine-containing n=1 Tax=Mesobacillus subterraneus TaxID=285983 RepID=A0A427TP76_9BACI|nr:formate dehydrogenase H subunit alpha, selenocysteine-containing [Mesobacillus subterraneus]
MFGSGFPTNTLEDIDEAEVLLLMGSNTTEAHPIIGNRIKKAAKGGLQIVVIDPRSIDMVKSAHKHLQINVGTDIALINAMIHVIIKEGLYDQGFIGKHTEDFDALQAKVARYTPEYSAELTGLSAEEIAEVARMYATSSKSMIAYTLGITEHHCGVNNVFDIANLALLTGQIGKKGSGIMPLRGQNNVQGAGDMGCLPNQLTGAVSLLNDDYRQRFEKAWNVEISQKVGDTQTRTFDKIETGEIKALYCIGENPLLADVHMNHTRTLLEKLDLLIVQDIFMTETAEMADVVLPAKSWGEVDGTYTNTDRRVQRVRTAIEAQPNVKEDWEILCDLSTLMGYPMSYQSSEGIWDEVRELAWEMYGGITYARLENEYGIHYPCPDESHPGTKILHERFHADKEAERRSSFVPVDFTPPLEKPDELYPFTLTTGRRYESYNTHTQTRHYAAGVKIKQTEETLDIHPVDAARLNINNGDLVKVSSRRGSLTVKTKITEQVVPGLVFMSFHWSEVPTNVLTLNEYDPISGTAEFKACAVKIETIA